MQTIKCVKTVAVLLTTLCFACTAQASVVIQEVLYDGSGSDADDVFTELFGAPDTNLDGWSLAGINGGDGSVYRTIDLSGLVIPADGILVLATASANIALAALSDFVANVDWQNGPDALHLLNGASLVDALQYGDAGMFNAGEGMHAMDVSGDVSLSRNLLGADSNDNALDFSAGDPTPGMGPAVVPLPAAAWLFMSGLGLLGMLKRRT